VDACVEAAAFGTNVGDIVCKGAAAVAAVRNQRESDVYTERRVAAAAVLMVAVAVIADIAAEAAAVRWLFRSEMETKRRRAEENGMITIWSTSVAIS
jgi:hypothetical protein